MRQSPMALGLMSAALAIGCGPTTRNGDDDPTGDGGNGGEGNQDGCSDAAKKVYVVDSNEELLTWDPPTKTFTRLGALSCNSGLATPFSMGIDRSAQAWILYNNEDLFRVDTTMASLPCSTTTWNTQLGLAEFGMGFSTDAIGGNTDTLYVAGGNLGLMSPTSTMATLNTGSMQASSIGSVTGWPELTGTGNAELWGFFPATSGSRIEKINKATGAAMQTFPLPTSLNGQPLAWAFAAWGGDFWVFLMKGTETNTKVYQFDGSTGAMKGMTDHPGRTIVGAGVSTCAPTIIL